MTMYQVVTEDPVGTFTFDPSPTLPLNTISFSCGNEEILRVSNKGFWVRGVEVEQDNKEAENVYNSFRQWLTWQHLKKE